VRQRERGKRDTRGPGAALARDFGSQWLGLGLTWSQRCQCGEKTGDAGIPRSEMETVKLLQHAWLFFDITDEATSLFLAGHSQELSVAKGTWATLSADSHHFHLG